MSDLASSNCLDLASQVYALKFLFGRRTSINDFLLGLTREFSTAIMNSVLLTFAASEIGHSKTVSLPFDEPLLQVEKFNKSNPKVF